MVNEPTTVNGPVLDGEIVDDHNLTDRERALTDRHTQLRDLLTRYALLWRETARYLRGKGGHANIAAGAAYDVAAGDVEEALLADATENTMTGEDEHDHKSS